MMAGTVKISHLIGSQYHPTKTHQRILLCFVFRFVSETIWTLTFSLPHFGHTIFHSPLYLFRPLAAGAFVAPHTFSAKVAMGRPNAGDLAAAAELGRRAAEKLSGPWCAPELPGNRPYRSFQRAPFYPVGDDTCTRCGCCVGACPVEAIHPAAPRATDGEKCIRCLACVRACPAGSRRVEGPAFAATAAHLEEALTKEDKPPELYL